MSQKIKEEIKVTGSSPAGIEGLSTESSAAAVPTRATVYTTVYYIHSHDGKLLAEYDAAGACKKDYVYMGNRLIMEYQPAAAKKYYYTPDQVNSTRIVTDSAGTVVYSAVFDPYGGKQITWVDTFQPSLKFSGKERESRSEMDYFGARYYDHAKYRFLSVDPIINKDEALANPQLWNLYAYCRNNPISYLDPDGLTEITITINRTGANTTRTLGTMSVTNNTNNTTLSLLLSNSQIIIIKKIRVELMPIPMMQKLG